MPNDIIAYRVLKYRDGFGPQAEPDWKAKYEEAIDRHRCAIMALDSCQARAEKAEAQIVELEEKNQRQADDMATAEDGSMEFYRTRRPLPTPPKLIPLDINDIRATDEFKHRHDETVRTAFGWSCDTVYLGGISSVTYRELAANYLRRQHGSNEWKPCTKEETK